VTGPLVRRAAIFAGVAGLGLLLAWMLGGGRRGDGAPKPRLGVVDIQPGTDLSAPGGVPGISLLGADRPVVAPVQEVRIDGVRLPFRPLVLRGDSERPLPSPNREVRRALIVNPDLQVLPLPQTRAQYDAAAKEEPTTIRAPEGILDSGPGEALHLHFKGGVRARSVRQGTPWEFSGPEAFSDVRARTLRAPGEVLLVSKDLKVEGRDLDASDDARTVVFGGGARGSVASTKGVRLAGGPPGGETRFRCRGPLRVLPLALPKGADAGVERWRLVLEEDAVLEQDDGSLSGRRIEIDFTRPRGDGSGFTEVEEIRAEGAVALEGRGDGRAFQAGGEKLLARPRTKKGITDLWLDGSPVVRVRETAGGREVRSIETRCAGTAHLSFPAEGGPVTSTFPGGAIAMVTEPAAKEGDPPIRRDLQAAKLQFTGMRAGEGATRIEQVLAEGEALLKEDGDRWARARKIDFRPAEGGASRTVLEGDVLLSWPSAGALDPVGALAGAPADAPAAPGAPGNLLLSSPGKVVIDQPAADDASAGRAFAVQGGVVLRRVVDEREVYRLECASADARTTPGANGIESLVAKGNVRLAGREEAPGTRTYDLRGDVLEVKGAPGARDAQTADIAGAAGKPASAAFTGEDGRPFSVAGEKLRFDKATGAFRAEGGVRGTGVLPESRDAGKGADAVPGGPAELACEVLDGVLARGQPDGTTGIRSLDARGGVWVRTKAAYASGERLAYDAERGAVLLRGSPARVTVRTQGSAAEAGLEDRCESGELRLLVADGVLREARSEEGGLLVRHVPAKTGKGAAPASRVEARCKGPLSHGPAETRLQGEVRVLWSEMKGGSFVEKYRVEDADDVRVYHVSSDGGAARAERATATSAAGRVQVSSSTGGWKATGVARADMDVPGNRVVLESAPGAPRFRVESADVTMSYRRAVYDFEKDIFTEQVGATIEGKR
jgi:hypothetical protein